MARKKEYRIGKDFLLNFSKKQQRGLLARIHILVAIWMLFYGTSLKSRYEAETVSFILIVLKEEPPTTNPYWTLSDLDGCMKKTYADIQKAVRCLEEKELIETGKDWVKHQGNRRYIKLTYKGNDFLKMSNRIENKATKELKKMFGKKGLY